MRGRGENRQPRSDGIVPDFRADARPLAIVAGHGRFAVPLGPRAKVGVTTTNAGEGDVTDHKCKCPHCEQALLAQVEPRAGIKGGSDS